MIKEVKLEVVKDILKGAFEKEIATPLLDNPYNKSLIFIEDDIIKGILNYDLIYDRIEINYIVVIEKYRNLKIASKLLDYLIKNNNVLNITLEVNENNIAAINLYKKFGFKNVVIREKYYNNENAIMMIRM